jgi:hypothetical protein
MKKQTALSSERQQFWTFLVRKSQDGKMGLWFVLIFIPSMKCFTVLNPVWRKIQSNGLPKDLGTHGPFILGGDIKLLGGDDAGSNEKASIRMITSAGCVRMTVPAGMPSDDREQFFSFYGNVKIPACLDE